MTVVLALLAAAAAAVAVPPGANGAATLIRDVRVFDSETVRPGTSVLIRGSSR